LTKCNVTLSVYIDKKRNKKWFPISFSLARSLKKIINVKFKLFLLLSLFYVFIMFNFAFQHGFLIYLYITALIANITGCASDTVQGF